ncbi:MAG: dTDP-glucose 4,6-dehydratase [Acidobacteria bacterium]|nr:dTDP-glucose 4,6-dehydratase [Acidobacteriota bacterium]MBI3488951.1 dTDP-glucose 4,6-dehydratase [Acidobacteriota bacterium]
MKGLLVTGGAGFIGSHFVRRMSRRHPDTPLVVLDKLTYAADPARIQGLQGVELVTGDICDAALVGALFASRGLDAVVHFAAESHVDRSIDGPEAFIQTNLVGTFTLLEAARRAWGSETSARFLHVSTDEVYGSLEQGEAREGDPYAPNSPYSASKAGSDHLARAYHITYGLPVLVTHCTNNYGPFQHPEKLIPLAIHRMVQEEAVPIYGDGLNTRDWLFVEDHCAALEMVLSKGRPGATYGISQGAGQTNLALLEALADVVDQVLNRPAGSSRRCFTFVRDRPGHDRRYALNSERLRQDLGWQPETSFQEGLRRTVEHYLSLAAL